MSIYPHLYLYLPAAAISALDDALQILFKQLNNVELLAIPFLIVGGVVLGVFIFGLGAMEGMSERPRLFVTLSAITFAVVVILKI